MEVYLGPYTDNGEPREEEVEIHDYDTWSVDYTLSLIALPLLRQLHTTKHSAPYVDPEDVPIELKPTSKDEYGTDNTHFQRWDWVMNEMIFAMENIAADNWEDQFWEEHPEIDWGDSDNNEVTVAKEGKCDWEGRQKYDDRISRGCLLFGKYFRNLWD